MRRSRLGGAVMLAVVACDRSAASCPDIDTADLACPAEIGAFEASACGLVPDGPAMPVGIAAQLVGDALHVELAGVLFRDDNEICGYAERDGDDVRVLLQPCVLVPAGGVSKGDCWYEALAFDVVEDVAGATSVTVWHRVDSSAELPPDAPRELASATL